MDSGLLCSLNYGTIGCPKSPQPRRQNGHLAHRRGNSKNKKMLKKINVIWGTLMKAEDLRCVLLASCGGATWCCPARGVTGPWASTLESEPLRNPAVGNSLPRRCCVPTAASPIERRPLWFFFLVRPHRRSTFLNFASLVALASPPTPVAQSRIRFWCQSWSTFWPKSWSLMKAAPSCMRRDTAAGS